MTMTLARFESEFSQLFSDRYDKLVMEAVTSELTEDAREAAVFEKAWSGCLELLSDVYETAFVEKEDDEGDEDTSFFRKLTVDDDIPF